mgnify:CR=1 FL=1
MKLRQGYPKKTQNLKREANNPHQVELTRTFSHRLDFEFDVVTTLMIGGEYGLSMVVDVNVVS